jgi:hypothetical protein
MVRRPDTRLVFLLFALAVAGLARLPTAAAAQTAGSRLGDYTQRADSLEAKSLLELGVGFGPAVSLGFARGLDDGVGFIGGKLSWAWEENSTTLDANVWEPFILDLFYRRQIAEEFHCDVGPTFMTFATQDDVDPSGRLLGIYASAWFGKIVYAGVETRTGWLRDIDHTELGSVISFRVKAVVTI